jgi:SAM-dependent methyltransferase
MDAFCNAEEGATTCMHATNTSCGRQYLDLIAKELGLQWTCLKVLDYGAGEGDVSALLQRMGADVLALDPYGYDACGSKHIPAVRSVQEIPAGKKFDGIIMTEVVEHLSDPVRMLRQLSSCLREDGWIFLTTPNNKGLKARLLRDGWRESLNDGHVFLFSWGSLAKALTLAGFTPSLCRGFVRFSANLLRTALQYSLQALRMQGNIWVIGRKHLRSEPERNRLPGS